jgi:hypothetical protein
LNKYVTTTVFVKFTVEPVGAAISTDRDLIAALFPATGRTLSSLLHDSIDPIIAPNNIVNLKNLLIINFLFICFLKMITGDQIPGNKGCSCDSKEVKSSALTVIVNRLRIIIIDIYRAVAYVLFMVKDQLLKEMQCW